MPGDVVDFKLALISPPVCAVGIQTLPIAMYQWIITVSVFCPTIPHRQMQMGKGGDKAGNTAARAIDEALMLGLSFEATGLHAANDRW